MRMGRGRGSGVDFEVIGEVELFAEPNCAFGLGADEVVDCEGRWSGGVNL